MNDSHWLPTRTTDPPTPPAAAPSTPPAAAPSTPPAAAPSTPPPAAPSTPPAAAPSAPPAPRSSAPPSAQGQLQGDWAVQVMGLCKSFEAVRAVDSIDLAVPGGVFFGLLGPNGAGKSTTLAMLTGLLRPDAGTARVLGHSVWPDPVPVKARIGVVPETLLLFERLSGRELLDYVGRLRQLDADVVHDRSEELLAVLGLDDSGDKWVIDYSQGMRKKISLAAALIHAPDMLFLDEPFESVDPVSVRLIRSILADYVAGGGTVLLSSHVMATVESLCDAIAIMHNGKVVVSGTVEAVRAGSSLEDAFARAVGAADLDTSTLSWLRASRSKANEHG